MVELGIEYGEQREAGRSDPRRPDARHSDFIAPEQIDDANRQTSGPTSTVWAAPSITCSRRPTVPGRDPLRLLRLSIRWTPGRSNFVRPEVPAELAALVAKMMAKEPAGGSRHPTRWPRRWRHSSGRKPWAQLPLASAFPRWTPLPPFFHIRRGLLSTAPASTSAPKSSAPGGSNRPEERWNSLIDFSEEEDIHPPWTLRDEHAGKRLPGSGSPLPV